MAAPQVPVGPDTPISVKITLEGKNRKFKIPLAELGPEVLLGKLRGLLDIPDNQAIIFERYSDSAGSFIPLDPANPAVFKTLLRAAKAKLKLRLRASVPSELQESTGPGGQKNQAMPKSTPSPTVFPLIPAAQTSQTTLVNTTGVVLPRPERLSTRLSTELPTPRTGGCSKPPTARLSGNAFCDELAKIARQRELSLRPKPVACPEVPPAPPGATWSVYCNACDNPMDGDHYHCNTCDDGDYDLCQACVGMGVHCNNMDHWLIKRSIKDGTIVHSTTQKVAPKAHVVPQEPKPQEMPGAFTDEKKYEAEDVGEPTRTCNSCISVLSEREFVTCVDCEDYDLCIPCHEGNKHGHHPGHTFTPVNKSTELGPMAEFLCASGRNVRHSALCDGCDKPIFGVRHKCLNCPDWDYCSECYKSVKFIHPTHRFVPIYEPIPEPRHLNPRHTSIYCDGPLCKDKKEYIVGVRYKCAICDDTDFCGNCEASPRNRHNRTHPLIMFKTPVRSVSVTTWGDENKPGQPLKALGDTHAVIQLPPPPPMRLSQYKTVAELMPGIQPAPVPVTAPAPKPATKDKIEIKDLLAEPIEEKIKTAPALCPKPAVAKPPPVPDTLDATYVLDTIKDGTVMAPNQRFTQVWTLRNPGPLAWPSGCSVRYVGGDNMLDVDNSHPINAADISDASESNVIGRRVEAGEEISFRVFMKAPKREGVFISYWRLKAADGMPFGHRLWCHIKVVEERAYPAATVQPVTRSEDVDRPVVTDNFLSVLLQNQAARQRVAEQKAATAALMKAQIEELRQKDEKARAERMKALRDLASELQVRGVTNQIQARANAASAGQAAAQVAQKFRKTVSELAANETCVPSQAAVPDVKASEASGKEEPKADDSGMIFPKLEKESPESSTHDASTLTALATTTDRAAAVTSPTVTDATLDIFEDAESVGLIESSDDEPFLTDEEYDILDASDQEDAA